jgi:hypothetical protein
MQLEINKAAKRIILEMKALYFKHEKKKIQAYNPTFEKMSEKMQEFLLFKCSI